MRFYNKIFIAIFVTSSLVLAAGVASTYVFLSDSLSRNYHLRYETLFLNLSESLRKLDRLTEDNMRSSLEYLQLYLVSHPVPSTEELRAIAAKLNVSSIELIAPSGRFIRSNHFDVGQLPSLFSFCADYRRLFTGDKAYDRTPLVPSAGDGRVFKFSLLPTRDRRLVINIGTEIGFVKDLLEAIFSNNRNILSVGLFTPSNRSLGLFSRSGADDTAATDLADATLIQSRLAATVPYCCECVTKGLVKPGEEFSYQLRMKVSLGELRDNLHKLRISLIVIWLLGLGGSFVLARVIAGKLFSRIKELNDSTNQLMGEKKLNLRLNLPGNDELSSIADRFDRLLEVLEVSQSQLLSAEKSRALAQLAAQVAHDVRSPLAALRAVEHDLAALPEETRLMVRGAVSRIQDIANELLQRDPSLRRGRGRSVELVTSLIDGLITEKRQQFRSKLGIEIDLSLDHSSYGVFAEVHPGELVRALSNLVNNAVEAMGEQGRVMLSLAVSSDRFEIRIRDTGVGIPAEILPRLGRRGETFGKASGSGLGLYHARTVLEGWGGSLRLESEVGKGTTAIISLPKAAAPDWFASELLLEEDSTVAILDDDSSIHGIWESKLEPLRAGGHATHTEHFSTSQAIHEWIGRHRSRIGRTTFLIDYELLGDRENGLDVIESESLQSRSVLVTSRFEESSIRARCRSLGIPLVPKGMACFVPIRIVERREPAAEGGPGLQTQLATGDALARPSAD